MAIYVLQGSFYTIPLSKGLGFRVQVREPVQVRFTLRLRDQRSMRMQDGCKVYMDSCMASNGSRFMVTCIIFENHLLEVGPTQNHDTMACWFILFYHVWRPAWIDIHWNSMWLRPNHTWLHTTLEGPWPHYMILEVYWDGLQRLSFRLSQFHGHGSWLMCEVALSRPFTYWLLHEPELGLEVGSWFLWRLCCMRVPQHPTIHVGTLDKPYKHIEPATWTCGDAWCRSNMLVTLKECTIH